MLHLENTHPVGRSGKRRNSWSMWERRALPISYRPHVKTYTVTVERPPGPEPPIGRTTPPLSLSNPPRTTTSAIFDSDTLPVSDEVPKATGQCCTQILAIYSYTYTAAAVETVWWSRAFLDNMTILTIDETIGAKIFSEKWNNTYTIIYIGSCAF